MKTVTAYERDVVLAQLVMRYFRDAEAGKSLSLFDQDVDAESTW